MNELIGNLVWCVQRTRLNGLALWTGLALAVAIPVGSSEPDVRRDATVRAIEKVMPSVVNVSTETIIEVRDPLEQIFRDFFGPYYRGRPNAQRSLGSGVIIDESGYVLTNFHVVRRAGRVTVTLWDGREFQAEPVTETRQSDVALLKLIGTEGETFSAIELAADDDLVLGETVLALGNPFGLGESVSRGILSSKARRPSIEGEPMEIADWLQTDAAINPGNSGGPLVNLNGQLIGLNVAIYREGQGIGFAIPAKRISEALSEMFTPERIKDRWFGAQLREGRGGVTVAAVTPESPAARAGLKKDDVIIGLDDRTPRGVLDLNRGLIAAEAGRDIRLRVLRDEVERRMTVRLVPVQTFFNAGLVEERLGVSLQELNGELAQALGWNTTEGLLIAEVEPGSPSDEARLAHGMIVQAIDGEAVQSVAEMAKRIHNRARGERVQLTLLVQRRLRGGFVQILQTSATVRLR